MLEVTPALEDSVRAIVSENTPTQLTHSVRIFTGRVSVRTYCSIMGGAPIDISDRQYAHSSVPDDVVVIAVTHSHSLLLGDFVVDDERKYLDGHHDRAPTRFFFISLEDRYKDGDTYFRIPSLSLKFGINRQEVANRETCVSNIPGADLSSNLVGTFILPVVEDDDASSIYYINIMGKTHDVPTRTCSETNLPSGLYTYMGASNNTRLGTIAEFIFVDKTSLINDVVLFTNKNEAAQFSTTKSYYATLDSIAEAEANTRAKDLALVKSDTAILENTKKVEVIGAKSDHEISSIGRKETVESTTFGRNATLGAIATAGTLATLAVKYKAASTVGLLASIPFLNVPIVSLGVLFAAGAAWALIDNDKSIPDNILSLPGRLLRGVAICIEAVFDFGGSITRGLSSIFGFG